MAVSDDDGTAERLAQERAERRHVRRLRVGLRREASREAHAERKAERDAEHPNPATVPMRDADSRQVLAAQQDLLALDRGSLIADADQDGGIEFEM